MGAAHPTPQPAGRRRALITGGAGFIGSHLAEALLAARCDVTIVDNLSTGRRENLPPGARFIEADLGAWLPRAPCDYHEVYHLAAAVGVKLVIDDPITAIEHNVGDTAALLRWAAAAAIPPAVLVASSSEVYGKSERVPFSENDDVTYGPTSVGRWSYAYGKALDEYLALGHASRGLPVVVARFFNTVGPRQVGTYGMVVPRFVAAALRGEPLRVFGDGAQSRCFCDVRDVAPALPRLLRAPAAAGRVFNVGSDRSITIQALAELVIRQTGSRSGIIHVPFEQAYASGFEDLLRRQPDLARIREAIGFAPAIPLEQTIRDIAGAGVAQT
ncbi:MAG: NAD-dependent epimerase/dehydratase family protein [Phycisphaerales bacterium JB039]